MNKRSLLCFFYFFMSLMLSGCWDEMNIEERGFIFGMAIDLAEEDANGTPQLTITNQFVIPPGIGTPSDGGQESEVAYMNVSATGNSIFAIDQEIGLHTNKIPFLEHLKIIVVSEDVLQIPQLFPSIMDVFFRSNQIRRQTKIIVAKGEAKTLLDIAPDNEKLPAVYLDELLSNKSKYSGILHPIQLGEMHEHFLTANNFTIPQFTAEEKKVNYDAEAVFDGDEGKVVGAINHKEIQGFHLLMGKYQGGTIEFEHDGALVTFTIENAKRKVKMNVNDPEDISISYGIFAEGRIVEVFGNEAVMNASTLAELEKKASEKIEEITQKTIDYAQKELQTDIFDLGNRLRQREYDTWEEIKDNWDTGDQYFRNSTFLVEAKVRIRSAGDSEKSGSNEKE